MARPLLFGLISFLALHAQPATATWPADGTQVVTVDSLQSLPMAVPDGAGGVVVVWIDRRAGNDDLYAQRIDEFGVRLWDAAGVAVCAAAGDQTGHRVLADNGGVYVTWTDARTGTTDVFAQRIGPDGLALWAADGVPVCDADSAQDQAVLTDDGAGGVIVAWRDARLDSAGDIYTQRVSDLGVALWDSNGVAMCTTSAVQETPTIVANIYGGAIIAWSDARSGGFDIYARRVDPGGNPNWNLNGVTVCVALGDQVAPVAVNDQAGGAIIAWSDARSGGFDVYAQRIAVNQQRLWTTDGVAVCSAPGDQTDISIVTGGDDAAVLVWQDARSGTFDIYAQRLDGLGGGQWQANGVAMSAAAGDQRRPRATPDCDGGALVTWEDLRGSSSDVYAQRVDVFGATLWAADGAQLTSAAGDEDEVVVAFDGTSAALLAWSDDRGDGDIYAGRAVLEWGETGRPEAVIASVEDVPADQGGAVRVNWVASDRDVFNQQFITHYTVWRATEQSAGALLASGAKRVEPSEVGPGFSGAAFRAERTAGGVEFFWEYVAQQSAVYFSNYTLTTPTLFDSTEAGAIHYFQVLAHTAAPWQFWTSDPDSGYSVDNLFPSPPASLAAQRVDGIVSLSWQPGAPDPDLDAYRVYRGGASGFALDEAHLLATVGGAASGFDDFSADAGTAYVYRVVAVDEHLNASAPSEEVAVEGTSSDTGARPPAVGTVTIFDNTPNPFSRGTTIRFALPVSADVRLDVYDVRGRLVATRALGRRGAGTHEVRFAGRDERGAELASGVYFYTLRAAGAFAARKMIIQR